MNNINKEYMEAINKELEKKEFIELIRKKLINLTESIKEKDFNCELIDEIVANLKFDFNSDKKYKDICNVLRYRILNTHLQVFKNDLRDFDKYNKVIDEMKKYLDENSYLKENNILCEVNNGIFIINGKKYETDTANSFQTIFGQTMRKYIEEEYKGYIKKFKLKKYNKKYNKIYCIYRDYSMLIYLQNYKSNNIEFEKILEKLNELANRYHSINSIVLVPLGFNTKRNSLFKDEYSKSIKYLNSYENINFEIDDDANINNILMKTKEFDNDFYSIDKEIDNMLNFINN